MNPRRLTTSHIQVAETGKVASVPIFEGVMSRSSAAEPDWQLVTIRLATGETCAAVKMGDEYRRPDVLREFDGLMAVMRAWGSLVNDLRAVDVAASPQVDCAEVLAPLLYPNKVLCSGPNFRDHLAEMGESGLGDAWTPYFFFKPPSTSLIAAGAPVIVSGDPAERPDWEGELAAVIGVGGRDIPSGQALQHIAGYAVSNDISMRGPFHRDTPAAPFQWDWLAHKCADTSLPLGPGIVPTWLVGDIQDLKIRTQVNGEVKQDGWTGDMVFGVADLIAYASRTVTLEAGDVILTGTPAGVGAGRGEYLVPGDTVRVTIDGIGELRNPIQRRETR